MLPFALPILSLIALTSPWNFSHALAPTPKTQQPPSSSSRRDFLEKSLASGATAAIAATALTTASSLSLPSNAVEVAPSATLATSALKGQIQLPPLGLGAWAWGDSLFWGYDKKNDEDLAQVFDYAVQQSKQSKQTKGQSVQSVQRPFFDTAELYGLGRSEELLGKFEQQTGESAIIASKFAALPWRTKREDVVKACEASVKRLGGKPIDLYQIHFPNAYANEAYWDGLADCFDRNLVQSVGVSNYGIDAMRACHAKLSARGIKLATNQIQLSLLYRWPIENGLLDACRELDVEVLSYSPLALGFLTGKYNEGNLPKGPRAQIGKQLLKDEAYGALMSAMLDIASSHTTSTGEKASVSQVALNWAIAKGTIPIPGARNIRQVKQNLATLDWKLSREEEERLDDVSRRVTGFITPDKNPFPRVDKDTGLIMYDS